MSKTLKMTFGYGENQESTRNYTFTVADSLASACQTKIININDSLEAGTAGGLSSVFVADNGTDGLSLITYAAIEAVETQILDISGGASSAGE